MYIISRAQYQRDMENMAARAAAAVLRLALAEVRPDDITPEARTVITGMAERCERGVRR